MVEKIAVRAGGKLDCCRTRGAEGGNHQGARGNGRRRIDVEKCGTVCRGGGVACQIFRVQAHVVGAVGELRQLLLIRHEILITLHHGFACGVAGDHKVVIVGPLHLGPGDERFIRCRIGGGLVEGGRRRRRQIDHEFERTVFGIKQLCAVKNTIEAHIVSSLAERTDLLSLGGDGAKRSQGDLAAGIRADNDIVILEVRGLWPLGFRHRGVDVGGGIEDEKLVGRHFGVKHSILGRYCSGGCGGGGCAFHIGDRNCRRRAFVEVLRAGALLAACRQQAGQAYGHSREVSEFLRTKVPHLFSLL